MTALTKYQRLEASALWRDAPGARAREVVVGLREATIMLSDPRSEQPLTQWSLPAIERLNPGHSPARFAPGRDAGEELELDDPEMIAALTTVHRALERRKPRPGRLRGLLLGAVAVIVVAGVVFWLPGQVMRYAASVLPQPSRAALGDMALADLARLTGQPCKSVSGRRAAGDLAARLAPGAALRIEVLRDGLTAPSHLPGPVVLLPVSLVETAEGPDVIAGHVLAEILRAAGRDPALDLLEHAGLGATLRLLTTGTLPPEASAGFGEGFLARPAAPLPPQEDLLAAFRLAELSSAPYGAAIQAEGLRQQDPFPLGEARPALDDAAWLELQAICSE